MGGHGRRPEQTTIEVGRAMQQRLYGVENEEAKGVVVDAIGEVKEAVGMGSEYGGSGRRCVTGTGRGGEEVRR